jgi:kinesin family protein 3/17
VKQETSDVLAANQGEREELLETIRELRRHIQLKDMIIMNFVPGAIHHAVESRAQWDEDKDEWLLGPLDTSNVLARPGSAKPGIQRPTSEFSRIKAALGDANPRFRNENIITLELDMPERTTQDYNDLQAPHPDELYNEAGMGDGGYGMYADQGQQGYSDNPYADMQYGGPGQMARY